MLLRGIAVLLVIPVWIAFGLAMLAFASQADKPLTEDQLAVFGVETSDTAALQTAIGVAVIVGLAVHGLAVLATSRATAAMAGAAGGLMAVAFGAVSAVALAAAPPGEQVDVLRRLVQPVGIAVVAVTAVVLGFRAFLAHTGTWRYRRWAYAGHDDWVHFDGGD